MLNILVYRAAQKEWKTLMKRKDNLTNPVLRIFGLPNVCTMANIQQFFIGFSSQMKDLAIRIDILVI